MTFKSSFFICIILLISSYCFGQNQNNQNADSPEINTVNDTLIHLNLIEIDVVPEYSFKNKRQEKKYNKLEQDLIAAYPLVKIVEKEFSKVNKEFESVYTTKKHKKEYMKWFEKHVIDTYMDTLTTLSMSQCRVLLTLIDRQTGQSPYKLIKEYRGTGRAVLYRTGAMLLGANLNATFDEEDDAMVAHILRRIESGELMPIEIEERYHEGIFKEDDAIMSTK